MAEEQVAVFGEEARNLGELRLVDIFVIAKAQVANRLDVDQFLHFGFEHVQACLQVDGHIFGGHVDCPPGIFYVPVCIEA